MNRIGAFLQGFVLVLYAGLCVAEVPSPIVAKDQCALMHIDQQRIEKKRETWRTIFNRQQTKQNISFFVTGGIIGGGLGALGWYMLHDFGDHKPLPADMMEKYKKNFDLNYAVYVGNEFSKGPVRRGIDKAFEMVMYTCLGALCMSIITACWKPAGNYLRSLIGSDAQQLFIVLSLKTLRDFKLMGQSLMHVINDNTISDHDTMCSALHMQALRDMHDDNRAFIHSYEEWMAFLMATLEETASQSEDRDLRESLNGLLQTTNSILDECTIPGKQALLASQALKGLSLVYERCVMVAGRSLYGESFSLLPASSQDS